MFLFVSVPRWFMKTSHVSVRGILRYKVAGKRCMAWLGYKKVIVSIVNVVLFCSVNLSLSVSFDLAG